MCACLSDAVPGRCVFAEAAGRYVVKAFYEVQSSEDPVRTAWLKEFAEDTLATGALGWVRLDWPSRVTSLHPPPLAACMLLFVPPRCWGLHHNCVVGCVFAVVPLCASPAGTIRPPPLLLSTSKAAVQAAYGASVDDEKTKSIPTQVRVRLGVRD